MFLPEEIWLIIFQYLNYYDINNLDILDRIYNKRNENIFGGQSIKKIRHRYYFHKFYKDKLVRHLIYTYNSSKKKLGVSAYMQIFSKNYQFHTNLFSNDHYMVYLIRSHLIKMFKEPNHKRIFKNLTGHIGRVAYRMDKQYLDKFEKSNKDNVLEIKYFLKTL